MSRFARLALVVLAIGSVVVACGDSGSTSSSSVPGQVTVKDNLFTPKSETVKVGGTVTWKFEGKSAHNVTFDDFNSNLMKTGTYEHTFDTAGTFSYRCTIHTGMTAKVVVSDSAAP